MTAHRYPYQTLHTCIPQNAYSYMPKHTDSYTNCISLCPHTHIDEHRQINFAKINTNSFIQTQTYIYLTPHTHTEVNAPKHNDSHYNHTHTHTHTYIYMPKHIQITFISIYTYARIQTQTHIYLPTPPHTRTYIMLSTQ